MLESIVSVLSATIKQASPAVLLGIAIATGTMIFGSEMFLTSVGLTEFRQEYRPVLGVAFIASVSILGALGLTALATLFRNGLRERRRKRQAAAALHSLTPDEKAYLIPFVLGGQSTQYFKVGDGVAGGLSARGIIYRSSSVGSIITGFAHNLQPWAREYLEAHPWLLEGANPNPAEPPEW